MALEQEILRKTWYQKLKVCFRLASDQVHQKEAPAPVILDIPRHTYFPLVVENLRSYFAQFVKAELQKADIRVEYCGLPLHMHYPIGTSFDLFAYDISPPWILTLRFEKYAGCEILYSSRAGAVRNYFLDSVKLADERKHSNKCMVYKRLKINDREQLWTGFVNNDFDKFWAINSKLMGKRHGNSFTYIPFRIYQLDKRYIDDLFCPVDQKGKERTLQDLITKFTPEIIPYQERMHVLVQGFDIPIETKLQWLSEHFSYPDNFLHICIVPKT